MQYKIKNENRFLYIATPVVFILTFLFLVMEATTHSPVFFYCMLASLALGVIFAVLAVISHAARTKLIVDEDAVTIKHLFSSKKIPVKDIVSVNIDTIKRYRRKPEIHYEYKKKMTMSLLSGKNIVLYDDASMINGLVGFVTGEREQMPDYQVPLCQAYEQILTLIKK